MLFVLLTARVAAPSTLHWISSHPPDADLWTKVYPDQNKPSHLRFIEALSRVTCFFFETLCLLHSIDLIHKNKLRRFSHFMVFFLCLFLSQSYTCKLNLKSICNHCPPTSIWCFRYFDSTSLLVLTRSPTSLLSSFASESCWCGWWLAQNMTQ